jgi:hypothetical protein
MDTDRCPSCGTPWTGEYCARCGEKRLDGRPTFGRFLREWLAEATAIDGKWSRTIKALLFQPGQLTRDYLTGRRRPTMKPLTLFLLLNVVYFLIQPLANINTFNSTLKMQTRWYIYAEWARGVVQNKMAFDDVSMNIYEPETLAKSLIIVQFPLLAVWMLLVTWRSSYLYDHLVAATHFYSFLLVLNIVATLIVAAVRQWTSDAFDLQWPLLTVIFAYAYLFVKGAYAAGILRSIFLSAWFLVGLTAALYTYRLFLFILTVLLT